MEKRNVDVVRLWGDYRLCALGCIVMLCRCVLSLNEEGQLLLSWKQDFQDGPDNNLSNWNAWDSTPCFWNGVSCTEGSVSALDFSSFFKLVGDIHALSFAKFANLTSLNVGGCTNFRGDFPQDIVNCSKLVYLNLSQTMITGEIPAGIINLHHLQVLDLTYAEMEGTVVGRIGELQELRVLRLGGNHFVGPIPESILSLTKLEELSLSTRNNWNGTLPLGFFMIPNLRVLWLGSDSDLLNTVPWPDFSLWDSSMEELGFDGVNFPPAPFPVGIFKMAKLRILHLSRCNMFGPIPSLENMTHLEEIHFGNNMLTGHIPDMFGSMPNLTKFSVFLNQLTGPLPPSLWQCRKLGDLTVFNNGLYGDLAGLANLSGSLTYLELSWNNFSGEIPPSLSNLALLTTMSIQGNYFTGEIPPWIGNLSQVSSLNIGANNFHGSIPPSLGNLSQLAYLSLPLVISQERSLLN